MHSTDDSTPILLAFTDDSTPILLPFYSHSDDSTPILLPFYSHSTEDCTPILLPFYYWFYSHSTHILLLILLLILLPFYHWFYSHSTNDSTSILRICNWELLSFYWWFYSLQNVSRWWLFRYGSGLSAFGSDKPLNSSSSEWVRPLQTWLRQSSVQLNCSRVSSDERHRATDPFLIDSPAPAFSYLIVGVRNILQSHKKFDWWEIHEIVYWWIRSHECWDYWEIAHTLAQCINKSTCKNWIHNLCVSECQ